MIRHALVTGASGFVGSVLCAALRAQGVAVTAVQRTPHAGAHAPPWDHAIAMDLARAPPGPWIPQGVDTVFHLAGHAHARDGAGAERLHREVSVEGTRRLLGACGPQVARIVYASSVKAMGESTPRECVDESAPPRPSSAYGRARLEAEALVLAEAGHRHAAVVRLPLVYGPGVKGNLARMMRAVERGRTPLLPEFGDRRSLVHVEDACAAMLAAARAASARGKVYLVTDGACYSSRGIQRAMYQAIGRPLPWTVPAWALRAGARAGDLLRALGVPRVPLDSDALARLASHACFDCARARRDLGYAPAHTLARALPAMFAAAAERAR